VFSLINLSIDNLRWGGGLDVVLNELVVNELEENELKEERKCNRVFLPEVLLIYSNFCRYTN